jgi:hypothetical protein
MVTEKIGPKLHTDDDGDGEMQLDVTWWCWTIQKLERKYNDNQSAGRLKNKE